MRAGCACIALRALLAARALQLALIDPRAGRFRHVPHVDGIRGRGSDVVHIALRRSRDGGLQRGNRGICAFYINSCSAIALRAGLAFFARLALLARFTLWALRARRARIAFISLFAFFTLDSGRINAQAAVCVDCEIIADDDPAEAFGRGLRQDVRAAAQRKSKSNVFMPVHVGNCGGKRAVFRLRGLDGKPLDCLRGGFGPLDDLFHFLRRRHNAGRIDHIIGCGALDCKRPLRERETLIALRHAHAYADTADDGAARRRELNRYNISADFARLKHGFAVGAGEIGEDGRAR